MTAFNGLPYAVLIQIPVLSTSHQAFNSDTKGLILVDISTKAFLLNKFTNRSTRKSYHFLNIKCPNTTLHEDFLLGSDAA